MHLTCLDLLLLNLPQPWDTGTIISLFAWLSAAIFSAWLTRVFSVPVQSCGQPNIWGENIIQIGASLSLVFLFLRVPPTPTFLSWVCLLKLQAHKDQPLPPTVCTFRISTQAFCCWWWWFLFHFVLLLFWPYSLVDLSSLPWGWTWTLGSKSTEC